jgi:hypothetical protein
LQLEVNIRSNEKDDADLEFVFQDFPPTSVKRTNNYPSPPLQRPSPEPLYLHRPPQQQPRPQQHFPNPMSGVPLLMPENTASWQQEIEIMCRDLLHR